MAEIGEKKGENGGSNQNPPPEKTCWHLFSLQELYGEKFIKVVNKILRREYILIK